MDGTSNDAEAVLLLFQSQATGGLLFVREPCRYCQITAMMKALRSFDRLLLALLVVLLTPSCTKPPGAVVAGMQISLFNSALAAFHNDCGFYPGTNGLIDLVRQPAGAINRRGPYLLNTNIPFDPWARPYVYKFPGAHTGAGYPYDLLSLGPPGMNKPIVNWADNGLKARN